MPTDKINLVLYARKSGEATTMFMGKHQHRRIDSDGNSVPTGVRLNIAERVKLLELKEVIEKILEDCKDDGY